MYLSELKVKNFRLLKNTSIKIEQDTTLIVGRNNSGKTSFTHLLGHIFSDKTPRKLDLCDFSIDCVELFKKIALYQKDVSLDRVNRLSRKFPQITIDIIIDFSENQDEYPSSLLPFLIDIETKIAKAKIKASYSIANPEKIFEFISCLKKIVQENKTDNIFFLNSLSELIPKYYSWNVITINPNDKLDTMALDFNKLSNLMRGYFISAQRSLGDYQGNEKDSISSVIKTLITKRPEAEKSKSALADSLSLRQSELTNLSQKEVDNMIPRIASFGSQHMEDIAVEVRLNIDNFAPHLNMSYLQGNCGMRLPEHYNGLGRRNLLLISIKLVEYIQSYKFSEQLTDINLIFIEEPEAYFHPQMQETFIKILLSYKAQLEQTYLDGNKWPVQFIITTHSSHIANKENFQKIRYFKTIDNNLYRKTIIKDLSRFSESPENIKFLRQYLTLTVCDLFFADKLVLVEGNTERILFSKLVKVFEEKTNSSLLSSQYIAILEVGGAYAHIFYNLIDFLKIPSLVITDIDSIDPNLERSDKTCCVSEGKTTSNPCIKNWFNDNNELLEKNFLPTLLINCTDEEKVKDHIKIAYQVAEVENFPCGRSFEAALILANLESFGINGADINVLEKKVWDMTKGMSSKRKVALSFEYAFEKDNWNIPKYIKDGLDWLQQQGVYHD